MKKNEFANERQAIVKSGKMENKDNQVFARIQSTPLEDQKKLTFPKKLKVSAAASFVPGGGSAALAGFLGGASTTEATPNFTAPPVTKPTPSNGFNTSTAEFVPGQTTTASKPFAMPTTTPSTQPSSNATQTTNTPTGSVTTLGINKQPSETAADGATKKKLKLGSTSFNMPAAAPAKNSPVKKTGAQGSTIALQSAKIGGSKELGPIAESEEKQDKVPTKPVEVTENKKPETAGADAKKLQKPKEEEVKERSKPFEPAKNNKATEIADKEKKEKERLEKEKLENEKREKEEKARLEKERLEAEKREKEEKARLEKEKLEAEKREKEENERKEAERKAAAEKAAKEAAPKEIRFEIVVMSRVDLESAVLKIAEAYKDRRLPEIFERIRAREIILESSRKRDGGKGPNYGNKEPQPVKTMERNPSNVVSAAAEDGGFMRGSMVKKDAPAEPAKGMGISRVMLTEEERKKKDELCNAVGVWIKNKKAETDPEEATRKEIKFNLNIITLDNFDVIKEKIHDLASAKADNCKRVAEFIIENAWTQKQYVNTYAKLCDYLGRSERLYFDDGNKADSKKRKNQFKLHIMKQIQTVFEDESQTNLGFKKPVEEMEKEERSLYYQKKKQRILGNVSFIGELFLEKFLVIGIVRIITTSLLQKFLEEYSTYQKAVTKPETKSYEDTLEGLLKFYEIIGKSVEEKEAAKPVDTAKSNAVVANFQKLLNAAHSTTPSNEAIAKIGADEVSLEGLFKIYDTILNQAALSTRLDSLVKNLIHRKENKWVASISKNQGPKTLKELHEEFEKEQIEMERRGDEYREELMNYGYQPRDQGRQQRGGQKEVYFQVAQESKSKQAEETKIDMKSINVDTNISFKPNRGKGGDKGDPKAVAKKPRVSFEEIDKELKEVYKILNGEQIEDKGTPEEEIKKLAEKFGGKELLHVFYRDFYDGRLDAVKKRLFIPNLLIDAKAINEDEFFEEFTRAMHRMFEVACDYPGSDASYATIFLEYCKKIGDLSPLEKISFPKEFYENEDCDLVLEFYQDFFRAFIKSLEDDYPELQAKEETLKEFAKKIKIEDYEDFKSTI